MDLNTGTWDMNTMTKEYQVTVTTASGKDRWYTLWVRNVYFMFRGPWRAVKPTHQPTYKKAMELKRRNK